ncbi:MAG: polysaccharide deacetylase family protein [Fibrobacterota bacterium]
MRVILSIHDVMPETFAGISRVADYFLSEGADKICFLVVPHPNWKESDLLRLREYQINGISFAGHGFLHHCGTPRTVYHKIHSVLISRNAAEHLAFQRGDLIEKVSGCAKWFEENGFGIPDLYVPPAWAMGQLKKDDMMSLPFRYYEFLSGVYDSDTDRFFSLPLAGFEADTELRKYILFAVNGIFSAVSKLTGRPLRVAVHPYDLQFKLRKSVQNMVGSADEFLNYSEILCHAEAIGKKR